MQAALLIILLITNTSEYTTNGKVEYTLVDAQGDMNMDQCFTEAAVINSSKPLAPGNVTAACMPAIYKK